MQLHSYWLEHRENSEKSFVLEGVGSIGVLGEVLVFYDENKEPLLIVPQYEFIVHRTDNGVYEFDD